VEKELAGKDSHAKPNGLELFTILWHRIPGLRPSRLRGVDSAWFAGLTLPPTLAWSSPMVGKTISYYRILEKLGGAARGELRVEEVRTEAPGRNSTYELGWTGPLLVRS
jgi:hypothetical protein